MHKKCHWLEIKLCHTSKCSNEHSLSKVRLFWGSVNGNICYQLHMVIFNNKFLLQYKKKKQVFSLWHNLEQWIKTICFRFTMVWFFLYLKCSDFKPLMSVFIDILPNVSQFHRITQWTPSLQFLVTVSFRILNITLVLVHRWMFVHNI